MPLVTLRDVVKAFDGVRAVDGVSFSIGRGEVVGFLGPNGAGKTTTMRLITNHLEPDSGLVEIEGQRVDQNPREMRRRIGYLPETNPLYTDMLVSEYLDYVGRLREMPREERRNRTEEVVAQTGIEEVFFRPIEQLSKGYRQRVGLAQAILAEPEILILDEPTEGLDPNQRVEIRNLIRRVGSERTVLLSTHVLQEVQLTCNRVVIIHRGRIIADDPVDALLAGGRRGMKVSLELEAESGEALPALQALESVAGAEVIGGDAESGGRGGGGGRTRRFLVSGREGRDPRREIFDLAVSRGWPVWELHLERESLEELFHELTGTPEPREEAEG
ncbi:MAG: ATP-binding cassette domain-containing protein [Gemmatimonadota bacterium]